MRPTPSERRRQLRKLEKELQPLTEAGCRAAKSGSQSAARNYLVRVYRRYYKWKQRGYSLMPRAREPPHKESPDTKSVKGVWLL
jgi:hypothetical protein